MSSRGASLKAVTLIDVNRRLLFFLFGLVAIAVCIWAVMEPAGWDYSIYRSAIRVVAAGHDPYANAIAIQKVFHSQLAVHPNSDPPYSYVYSPITLPFLRLAGHLPFWLAGSGYWLLYLVGVLTQLWVTLSLTTSAERKYFVCFAPVAVFFPGLLASGILLSGNVAYILYAAILLTAAYGWSRGTWCWFYVVVIVASCVKAPLLSLVVIPILTVSKQLLPALITAISSLTLFVIQPFFSPVLFHNYLEAVDLQFRFNRDFGFSPAGLFSGILYDHHIPYSPGGLVFFLCYAIPLFGFLLFLAKAFQRGRFSSQQWIPVMLVGVVLLNPRLIEYDVAPLSIPLALIAWRFLVSVVSERKAVLVFSIFLGVANAFALMSWAVWKIVEGPLLVSLFLIGSWTILQKGGASEIEHVSRED